MTMTAEQLEELLRRSIFSEEDSRQLSSMAPSLARRVIAADKLVEAYFDDSVGLFEFVDMMNAYREASKGETPQ